MRSSRGLEKILITGSSGFVGGYLAEYLQYRYPESLLHGTYFRQPAQGMHAIPSILLHACDIREKKGVSDLIRQIRPDVIFHLAAQSYVSSSWEKPESTLNTNIIGQSNVLEAIREHLGPSYNPKIIIACSSEEYGITHDATARYDEQAILHPQSPYAISKVAQDFMGYQYFKSYGMAIVRLRVFNHTGPGRDPVFGISNFCKRIAEIELEKAEPMLAVRDLTAIRDFTDVRDIVRAYDMAWQSCRPGEVYNVCSGRGLSFKQILDALLSYALIRNIVLAPDPAGSRPTDGGRIVGDNGKFGRVSGWRAQIDFLQKTLPDMLAYWRMKISTTS